MRLGADSIARLYSVTHCYGAVRALDDVSIAVPSGKLTGLVGPDGVGKSTLLGLVAGARAVQAGHVKVMNGDMASAASRRAVCSHVAYMPQGLGRSLYPTLSVVENVDFAARLVGHSAGERRRRIEELLHATGLEPFADRQASKLSGGMKQKLSLCCALVRDPNFLILDEPTTGVDPLSRKQFWDLINRIRAWRPGMSVLTASTYMEEAMRFDWLIAMDEGRILAEGTPGDLIRGLGVASLEDAFIALLPEERRRGHRRPEAPPLASGDGRPAIEAERLTKTFNGFVAVDDVSVSVRQGEIFGFLGSNGCGKTTTMKMLTGLLPPTSGAARLFGRSTAEISDVLQRVGYMSQAFSLYAELSVRQNLELHARLFDLPAGAASARVAEMLERFDLNRTADALPRDLPLGVRQRLQLAVAVIHSPDMLILDEPTSGVDPIARDHFWELLIELSRRDGVTIFISTHYINEAERCDRVSLMHAGRILAMGSPAALRQRRSAATLEEAFIGYLEDAAGDSFSPGTDDGVRKGPALALSPAPLFHLGRLNAFAWREAIELIRDPIRLAFAFVGPLILAAAMTVGISFDMQNVRFVAFDGDRSQESQALIEEFVSSPYFSKRPAVENHQELERRLRSGKASFAIVIPPGYGRDLIARRQPEIAIWADGSSVSRSQTVLSYAQGAIARHIAGLKEQEPRPALAKIEPRFRFNQTFTSRNAIAPGVLMLLTMLFSAMLTALGVVREKEMGSIVNFYVSPAGRLEFLIGKQIPYVAVALISFLSLTILLGAVFEVPPKDGFVSLALGAALFAMAATALGLVISAFVRSQIAAIYASAIVVTIPALNFSGMIYPAASLSGAARAMGAVFPAGYFQKISAGAFNRELGLADLYANHLALAGFCLLFWGVAALLLKKQEA